MINDKFRLLKAETISWLKVFGFLSGVFVLFATITSFVHGVLGLRLVPVFENTIDAFRNFVHWVVDKLFLDWVLWLGERITYIVLLGLSYISNITPYLPQFSIPLWVKDLAIISMILLRSQKRAMSYHDPLSTLAMSELERSEWKNATRRTKWYWSIPITITWIIVLILYRLAKPTEIPFRAIGLNWVGKGVSLFVGGTLMLGFAYLSHDLLTAIATRHFHSRYAVSHRRFMFWMMFSILSAVLASWLFFILNGYMLDEMSKPN